MPPIIPERLIMTEESGGAALLLKREPNSIPMLIKNRADGISTGTVNAIPVSVNLYPDEMKGRAEIVNTVIHCNIAVTTRGSVYPSKKSAVVIGEEYSLVRNAVFLSEDICRAAKSISKLKANTHIPTERFSILNVFT